MIADDISTTPQRSNGDLIARLGSLRSQVIRFGQFRTLGRAARAGFGGNRLSGRTAGVVRARFGVPPAAWPLFLLFVLAVGMGPSLLRCGWGVRF